MKARHRIEKPFGIVSFNLDASILPGLGAGGVGFKNSIADFEYLLTEIFFDPQGFPELSYEIDDKYFVLTLNVKENALKIQFDILTGMINFIECGFGYTGDFNETLKVGIETKGEFFIRNALGFDLDLYWFSRSPFDGLVIFPPGILRDSCWDAGASGKRYPEFTVDRILVLNPEYAVNQFGTELRLSPNSL